MTAQMHEALILDGEVTSMAFCPDLPAGHARVVAGDPEKARKFEGMTGCWRGYRGTWMIEDGRFYLVGIAGRWQLTGDEPLFAEWFSGTLRIPRGELLRYVHGGFQSEYEADLLIGIKNGRVVSRRLRNNRAFDRAMLVLAVVLMLVGALLFALARHKRHHPPGETTHASLSPGAHHLAAPRG
jgi:hypothetical protein